MQYRAEINGLRALAVVPVILFHAGFEAFSGGFVGVDVFFVISGYLITTIIFEEKKAGNFTYRGFYERRLRRILPALFFVMLFCLPISGVLMLPGEMKAFSQSILAVTVSASNILFWRTSGYFDVAAEFKPLIHTWSLAVEEQFYIFYPILISLIWKFGKARMLAVLICIALISLLLAQWGSLNKPTAAFFLLPTRVFELIIGAAVALVLASRTEVHNISITNYRSRQQLGSAIGFFLIAFSFTFFNRETPFPGVYALVPTVGTALIIFYTTPTTFIGRVLSSGPFVLIGLCSYSAYLWHQPMLAFARIWAGGPLDNSTLLILSLMLLGFTYFTWKYIETPFRDKNILSRRDVFRFSFFGASLLVLIGGAGVLSNGFLFRYKIDDRYLAAINYSELGKYVAARFSERMMVPFGPPDGRKNILIIGDSYGQDLVNAVFESGADKSYRISTRYILQGCGNLFINRDVFLNKLAPDNLKKCLSKVSGFGYEDLYVDDALRALMVEADEVWYASAWEYWQAELIDVSVRNTQALTGKPVRVFGRKNFGTIDVKYLLSLTKPERVNYKIVTDPDVVKVNEVMRRKLDSGIYIDMQRILCQDQVDHCNIFTNEAELISHDGGHLTRVGAIYLGSKIFSDGKFVY